MTEAEWLAASEVPPMLQFLGKRVGIRKRRLFACACVRRIWDLLDDPRSQQAVEVGEEFADGKVDKEAVKVAQRKAMLLHGLLKERRVLRHGSLQERAGLAPMRRRTASC